MLNFIQKKKSFNAFHVSASEKKELQKYIDKLDEIITEDEKPLLSLYDSLSGMQSTLKPIFKEFIKKIRELIKNGQKILEGESLSESVLIGLENGVVKQIEVLIKSQKMQITHAAPGLKEALLHFLQKLEEIVIEREVSLIIRLKYINEQLIETAPLNESEKRFIFKVVKEIVRPNPCYVASYGKVTTVALEDKVINWDFSSNPLSPEELEIKNKMADILSGLIKKQAENDNEVIESLARVSKLVGDYKPSCFISYAWGDKDQEAFVRKFARQLKDTGVNVDLDVDTNRMSSDSVRKFVGKISTCDYVLIFGSPEYVSKAKEEVGSVARTEMDSIFKKYKDIPDKVIRLLLAGDEAGGLPTELGGGALVYKDLQTLPYFDCLIYVLEKLYEHQLANQNVNLLEFVKTKIPVHKQTLENSRSKLLDKDAIVHVPRLSNLLGSATSSLIKGDLDNTLKMIREIFDDEVKIDSLLTNKITMLNKERIKNAINELLKFKLPIDWPGLLLKYYHATHFMVIGEQDKSGAECFHLLFHCAYTYFDNISAEYFNKLGLEQIDDSTSMYSLLFKYHTHMLASDKILLNSKLPISEKSSKLKEIEENFHKKIIKEVEQDLENHIQWTGDTKSYYEKSYKKNFRANGLVCSSSNSM